MIAYRLFVSWLLVDCNASETRRNNGSQVVVPITYFDNNNKYLYEFIIVVAVCRRLYQCTSSVSSNRVWSTRSCLPSSPALHAHRIIQKLNNRSCSQEHPNSHTSSPALRITHNSQNYSTNLQATQACAGMTNDMFSQSLVCRFYDIIMVTIIRTNRNRVTSTIITYHYLLTIIIT